MDSDPFQESVRRLSILGFTELEAAVYTFLAESSSATAYEYLFAFLDREGEKIHQAIWSASAFLAWVQHSYLADSLRANLLEGLFAAGASKEQIEAARKRAERWIARQARGYRELRARFEPL